MASDNEAIDENLTAALQRSHSTPEPLFGHLDFNTGLNSHSNGEFQKSHFTSGASISASEGGGPKKTANGFHPRPPSSHVHHLTLGQSSPFGGHRSNSFDLGPRGAGGHGSAASGSKHRNRLSALGRLFKPWKWKRRKKSEKFEKTSKSKRRPRE